MSGFLLSLNLVRIQYSTFLIIVSETKSNILLILGLTWAFEFELLRQVLHDCNLEEAAKLPLHVLSVWWGEFIVTKFN